MCVGNCICFCVSEVHVVIIILLTKHIYLVKFSKQFFFFYTSFQDFCLHVPTFFFVYIQSILLFLLFPVAVLLQCHGGGAAGVPEVPTQAQTQAPATRYGENGGGHQHAHFQRPQTARERDHGLKWESRPCYHPLSCSEEVCRDTGENGGGKW